MARKSKTVAKFGGVDQLGTVRTDLHANLDGSTNTYDTSAVEAQSQTNLEMDKGEGGAVVLRFFKFAMNPQVFKERPPSKQELFNSHLRGIEMALYKDGLKVFDAVQPRLQLDEKSGNYTFVVAALPRKGYSLNETPQTLTQIAHN